MLLLGCWHVERVKIFLLLCVPCHEITQDCTKSLLRNYLIIYLKVKSRKEKLSTIKIKTMIFDTL